MRSHRGGATRTRVGARERSAPGAERSNSAIRVAASAARPAAARAALLAGVCLTALAVLAPHAAHAQQGPFLYVPNTNDNNVSVIDTPTNTTVPPAIGVGAEPFTAAVRGDQALVYVTNANSNTVSVINTGTNAVVASVGVGSFPTAVAVSPDSTHAYVTNFSTNNVSVINTATNTVVATVAVGNGPVLVAVSPDGTRAYVTNENSNNVSVISTGTNTVVATVAAGNTPIGVAVSPDGTRAYVSNVFGNTVSVISTATNAVVATVAVGSSPEGIAVSPDGTRAYVANAFDNTVSVISTATNTVVATLAIGNVPFGVAFSPDGTRAYVTNDGDNTVSVINTGTNTVVTTIGVGSNPGFPGICSNGNALLAAGLTFTARTSGALACTLASGPTGSPGPVFTGGTLQIARAGIMSALPITLTSQGGTVDTNGNSATLSGTISGSGGLTKTGAGTLTLTGNSSYQGGTALNAGTLAVGSNTALGTGALAFASGTTLQAAANGLSLANAMTLSGADTVDTQTNALTLSGAISGTGGLTKIGSGTLTLSGASSYAGPTSINAGILDVNGSLASTVLVNSGGTLMGNGTIGGLNVTSGGVVAPGNSIGTLNVAGNVGFAAGSIYQVEANAAGQSDQIIAGGAATLTGGTVQVLAQNGSYARQTRYTILTASSGVSGTFASATSNLAFLTPTLSYHPNDVFLTLNRNDTSFAAVAQTPNQRSVAGALDRSPTFSPLVQAVVNLTGTGALQAFDALSGEVHGSVQATMVDDSRYIRQAVLGRLRQAPYAGSAGAVAALGSGGPMLAYGDFAADAGLAYADAKKPAFPIKAPPRVAPVQTPDLTFWAQGVGAWGKIDGDGNAADASRDLAGFFSGFDRRFGDWRAGLAAGYTNSSVRVPARASSATIDTAHVAAYAGTSFWAWNFRSGATFAWNTIGTSRAIVFPGFSEQASARYGAGEAQVFGELGYGMTFGAVAAEPFAGLAWVHLNTRSFTETGGVSALAGTGNNDDVGYSTLGARAAASYPLQNGMAFIPRASVAWQHAFGTVMPAAALSFQSTGAAFGSAGVPIARDAALVEAGGDLQLSAQVKVGVSYAGALANRAHDHSVKGNLTWHF